MKANTSSLLFAFSLGILSLAACSTPRLAVQDPEWAPGETYTVQGRQGWLLNQRISFGRYATEKVNRSWTKESSWSLGIGKSVLQVPDPVNIISYDHINRKQTLRFAALSPAGETADVYAATRVRARDLRIGEGNRPGAFTIDLARLKNPQSNNLYYVQIYLNGSHTPWQLVLDNEATQWQPGKYAGYLYGPGGDYYELIPARHLSGKDGRTRKLLMGSAGFEIRDERGVALASVSTIDRGEVSFSNQISQTERFLLENLCAALLLQELI